MEPLLFEKGLNKLIDLYGVEPDHVNGKPGIRLVVTDNNSSIIKMMRVDERFKQIKFNADVWHTAKIIKGDIMNDVKNKKKKFLTDVWIGNLINRLYAGSYYSAVKGDANVTQETLLNYLLHMKNDHSQCNHPEEWDGSDVQWISEAAYQHLYNYFNTKRVVKHLLKLSEHIFTSASESFFNVVRSYAEKRINFGPSYEMRTFLAALDFNENRKREPNVVICRLEKNGEILYDLYTPRNKGEQARTVCPRLVDKTYSFLSKISEKMQNLRTEGLKTDERKNRVALRFLQSKNFDTPNEELIQIYERKKALKEQAHLRLQPIIEQRYAADSQGIAGSPGHGDDSQPTLHSQSIVTPVNPPIGPLQGFDVTCEGVTLIWEEDETHGYGSESFEGYSIEYLDLSVGQWTSSGETMASKFVVHGLQPSSAYQLIF